MSDLLTVKDVARHCQIHEGTVRRHIAAGRLRSVRVGRSVRVRPEDLDSYLDPGTIRDSVPGEEEHRPFSLDDPFWEIVGSLNNPDDWWVSGDKRRALAEALIPRA